MNGQVVVAESDGDVHWTIHGQVASASVEVGLKKKRCSPFVFFFSFIFIFSNNNIIRDELK